MVFNLDMVKYDFPTTLLYEFMDSLPKNLFFHGK